MIGAAVSAMLRLLSPAGNRGRLIVLTYHRVPEAVDPLLPGEPDAVQFERHVREVARYCRVLPLPEAVAALCSGNIPDRAVSITFDDGYRNNHDVAAPILRRHGLPATFFVTEGAVRDGIMWNDLVVEAVRAAGQRLDPSVVGLSDVKAGEGITHPDLIDAILTRIKYLPLAERWTAAMALYDSAASGPAPRLMMTEADVVSLARQGFDIGGHTVTHPILAKLPAGQARQEIQGCFDWLRRLTGSAPRSFAYPNGRPGRDYGPEHVQMVKDAGFVVAASTAWACAKRDSQPLEVPRVSLSSNRAATPLPQLLKLYLSSYR
jgi:peptidoglycan/xylan/chitin deacetylase (PgdA/CDA1 family)